MKWQIHEVTEYFEAVILYLCHPNKIFHVYWPEGNVSRDSGQLILLFVLRVKWSCKIYQH